MVNIIIWKDSFVRDLKKCWIFQEICFFLSILYSLNVLLHKNYRSLNVTCLVCLCVFRFSINGQKSAIWLLKYCNDFRGLQFAIKRSAIVFHAIKENWNTMIPRCYGFRNSSIGWFKISNCDTAIPIIPWSCYCNSSVLEFRGSRENNASINILYIFIPKFHLCALKCYHILDEFSHWYSETK